MLQAQFVAVGVEPDSELVPALDERLVSHLGGAIIVGDDQARLLAAQYVNHVFNGRTCRLAGRIELFQWHTPSRVADAFAQRGQPQKDLPGDLALLRRQAAQSLVGPFAERADNATGLVVAIVGQPAPTTLDPELLERVLQEWQRTMLPFDVGQNAGDKSLLEVRARMLGRFHNHVAQRVGRQLAQEQLVVLNERHEGGHLETAFKEVSSQSDDDTKAIQATAGYGIELSDELAGLVATVFRGFLSLAAVREQLLELINHYQDGLPLAWKPAGQHGQESGGLLSKALFAGIGEAFRGLAGCFLHRSSNLIGQGAQWIGSRKDGDPRGVLELWKFLNGKLRL